MKPYGRIKTVRFSCKQDCHPPKGWKNWWEDIAGYLSRSRQKQIYMKEINKEINE